MNSRVEIKANGVVTVNCQPDKAIQRYLMRSSPADWTLNAECSARDEYHLPTYTLHLTPCSEWLWTPRRESRVVELELELKLKLKVHLLPGRAHLRDVTLASTLTFLEIVIEQIAKYRSGNSAGIHRRV